MEAQFNDLISYFELLATQHKSIQHSANEKHFARMEINEVLDGLNSTSLHFPLLILEGYSFSYRDNQSDNILKVRNGAFILLDHLSDRGNYNAMHDIFDNLENIGTDILLRMRRDKRNRQTPVVRHFDFNSIDAQLIMNKVGNNAGIRFLYNITGTVTNSVDNSQWLDYE